MLVYRVLSRGVFGFDSRLRIITPQIYDFSVSTSKTFDNKSFLPQNLLTLCVNT